MSSARLTFLPEPAHMTQAQVDNWLGRNASGVPPKVGTND